LLCVALAALPAMLVAGRLADVFGARLVPIFLVFFGAVEWLPGLAHSVSMLVFLLAVVGVGTGLLDIAINAHAARLEALHSIRIMDGLHAAFSGGVLVGGIGSGLLRHAGAHPVWILAAVGLFTALTALANLGPYPPLAPRRRRARLGRPLLIVGLVLALAFLVENGLEARSALFLE
jgi:MFS family permease